GDVSHIQATDDPAAFPHFAAPISTVNALPAHSLTTFTVSWSAETSADPNRIVAFSIYVSDNGGPFTPFVVNTTTTSAKFVGKLGHTYGFASVAVDSVGDVQATPTVAQATTAA